MGRQEPWRAREEKKGRKVAKDRAKKIGKG
jgi:hypothetical protein